MMGKDTHIGTVGKKSLYILGVSRCSCNSNCTLHLLHQEGPLQHGIGGEERSLGCLAQVDHPGRRGRLGRNRNGSGQQIHKRKWNIEHYFKTNNTMLQLNSSVDQHKRVFLLTNLEMYCIYICYILK